MTHTGCEARPPVVRFVGDLAAGNLIADAVAAGDWLRIAEVAAR